MLQTFGNHAEGQRLNAGDGFVAILAVGHNAGQRGHFSEPAAIVFALDFDRERHDGQFTIRAGCITRRD